METPKPNEQHLSREATRELVVDFLLKEQYMLTAFELLQELLEDGQLDAATRLQTYFADENAFPPEQMFVLQSVQVDHQKLLDDKEAAVERANVLEYELRLAREDVTALEEKLQRQIENAEAELAASSEAAAASGNSALPNPVPSRRGSGVDSPLVLSEKRDINCAVKQYLMAVGYKLTAMTFCDEVVDQDLDEWPHSSLHGPNALRNWYLHFISNTMEEAEKLRGEKAVLVQEKDSMSAAMEKLVKDLEASKKDLMQERKQVKQLKEREEASAKELNAQRVELSALKIEFEKACQNVERLEQQQQQQQQQEAKAQPHENGDSKGSNVERGERSVGHAQANVDNRLRDGEHTGESSASTSVGESRGDRTDDGNAMASGEQAEGIDRRDSNGSASSLASPRLSADEGYRRRHEQEMETVKILADSLPKIVPNVLINKREELLPLIMCAIERHPDASARDSLTHGLFNLIKRPDNQQRKIIMGACVALAKRIGPERTENELLPQCWGQIDHKFAERRLLVAQSCGELARYVRPEIRSSLILSILFQLADDSTALVREAVAHNLAMLIPLLQNHEKYSKVEELMLRLVCDSSGEVVETSLSALVPATVAWASKGKLRVSALLRIVLARIMACIHRCQPASGVEGSAEAHLRVLGERERWHIDILLRMLTQLLPELQGELVATAPTTATVFEDSRSHVERGSAPGAEETTEQPTRKLTFGERRMSQSGAISRRSSDGFEREAIPDAFSDSSLRAYAALPQPEWPAYDWLSMEVLPSLLQLACMLQPREEGIRMRLCQLFLSMWQRLGRAYLLLVAMRMLYAATGTDPGDLSGVPLKVADKIRGLRPTSLTGEKVARSGLLPLLLAGALGAPEMREGVLADYLRDLVLSTCLRGGAWSPSHTPELLEAFRFLSTFEEQHGVVLAVLWELVVNPTPSVKVTAAVLLGSLAPYVDVKLASQQLLPALITLSSDPNVEVKHASITALGTVTQHFKDEAIVDKIRVQMDSFLEDGSHEATMAVLRSLTTAVPVTIPSLREYLLQKVAVIAASGNLTASLALRKERSAVLFDAIHALDRTELSASAARETLVPAAQALLRDPEALDGAHREGLEVLVRERLGAKLAAISSVMTNFNKAAAMGTFFTTAAADSPGLLGGRKPTPLPVLLSATAVDAAGAASSTVGGGGASQSSEQQSTNALSIISGGDEGRSPAPMGTPTQEESRIKRMMRAKYEEMMKFRSKPLITAPPTSPALPSSNVGGATH